MKVYRIASLCVFLMFSALVKAQDIRLDTYKLGEGLNFSTDDGYKMRLTGYLQPYMDTKTFTDVDDNNTQNRFRMRRIRLRLDGNLKNERFKYRFAFDLSGTSEAGDANTSEYLLDAYVSYDITNRIKASFGQRSTFTDNRELFMASNTLQLVSAVALLLLLQVYVSLVCFLRVVLEQVKDLLLNLTLYLQMVMVSMLLEKIEVD